MLPRTTSIWQRDSQPNASGRLGAVQTDGIDTATPTGRLLFHILASIAEMERELIRERTMAGLLAAHRKNGPGRERKSVLTPKKRATAIKLLAAGDRPRDVAEAIGVSVATFYRHFPARDGEPAS